jgi:hypothetical protein
MLALTGLRWGGERKAHAVARVCSWYRGDGHRYRRVDRICWGAGRPTQVRPIAAAPSQHHLLDKRFRRKYGIKLTAVWVRERHRNKRTRQQSDIVHSHLLLHLPSQWREGELQKPPKHFPIVLPQLGNKIAEINVVVHDALDSPPHTTSSGGGGFRWLVKKPRLGSEGVADQSQLVHRPESPAACNVAGDAALGTWVSTCETRRGNVRICPQLSKFFSFPDRQITTVLKNLRKLFGTRVAYHQHIGSHTLSQWVPKP